MGHHRDVITSLFVVIGVVGSLGSLVLLSSDMTTIGIVGFAAGFMTVPLAFALLPELDLNELGFASAFATAFAVWAVRDVTGTELALETLVAVVVSYAGILCAIFTTRRWMGFRRTRRLLAAGAAGTGWAIVLIALTHRALPGPLLMLPAGLGVVLGGLITTLMVRELGVVHSAVGQMPWLAIALTGCHAVWFGAASPDPPEPATATNVLFGGMSGGVLLGFAGGGFGAMFGAGLRRTPSRTASELPEARKISGRE